MKRIIGIILIVIFVFFCVESQPLSIISSSVFTTTDQTEIQIYALMNTLVDVDENQLAEEVVLEHQQINGVCENTVYTLKMYRTVLHYRWNREYDTIICDENGAIICCEKDLGV